MPLFKNPKVNDTSVTALPRVAMLVLTEPQTLNLSVGDHWEYDMLLEYTGSLNGISLVNPTAPVNHTGSIDTRAGLFTLPTGSTWRLEIQVDVERGGGGGSTSLFPTILSGSPFPVSGTEFRAARSQDNTYANNHIWWVTPTAADEPFKVEIGAGSFANLSAFNVTGSCLMIEEWT